MESGAWGGGAREQRQRQGTEKLGGVGGADGGGKGGKEGGEGEREAGLKR